MSEINRQEYLQSVTRKLVTLTIIPLLVLFVSSYILVAYFETQRVYLVTMVFLAGLVGDFVSLQQRLPSIELSELKILSNSWL